MRMRGRRITEGSGNQTSQIENRFTAESAFSASDRDRVSPAESAFLVPRYDDDRSGTSNFKREGDALFRHQQGS